MEGMIREGSEDLPFAIYHFSFAIEERTSCFERFAVSKIPCKREKSLSRNGKWQMANLLRSHKKKGSRHTPVPFF
jgi:hypothetical protein